MLNLDGDDLRQVMALSDACTPDLVAPPVSSTTGFCHRCKTWTAVEQSIGECENCADIRLALGTDPLSISLVSLYSKPSPLRDLLTRYKGRDDGIDDFDPASVSVVRAMIGRYILEHGRDLAEVCGGFDVITVVPSTRRPVPHPLQGVLQSLNPELPVEVLLKRGAGDLGFRKPAIDGFDVAEALPPRRVLLVDDVYTTGARLNSAAAVLRSAGHAVSGAFVVARRVNPDFTTQARAFWDYARQHEFAWSDGPVSCQA